jgi:hypothetical protein
MAMICIGIFFAKKVATHRIICLVQDIACLPSNMAEFVDLSAIIWQWHLVTFKRKRKHMSKKNHA